MNRHHLFRKAGQIFAAMMITGSLLPFATRGQTPPAPFGAVPNARQIEYFHRERQIFIHFGMNTFTDNEIGTGNENPSQFNPTALDCNQWARTIKKAGFPAAILVVKHHDGFLLWPSKAWGNQIPFDVSQSTWKNGKGDVVKEFTDACRVWAIKPGLYLSPHDLHVPSGSAYHQMFMDQMDNELLRNYGNIYESWWDGNGGTDLGDPTMLALADSIHRIMPTCVIWSAAGNAARTVAEARWIGNENGIAGDPCWATEDNSFSNLNNGVLNGPKYVIGECDFSIRPGWFYHSYENNMVKSVSSLWNTYFESVGHNAVMLLNLPPDKRGLIYSTDSVRVDSLGCLIYGTFKTNLATGATVTALHPRGTGYEPANLVDTVETTYYAGADANKTDTITFNLGASKTFDVVMLQEVLELGHRTTGWSVDYSTNGTSWSTISALSNKKSIGYKWMEKFNPLTASYVRLRITAGNACPAVHTFGIYKQQSLRPPDPVTVTEPSPSSVPPARTFAFRIFGTTLMLPAEFANQQIVIDLLDINGRLVQHFQTDRGTSMVLLNKTSLRNGMFMVKCSAANRVVVRKFMTLR